MSLYRPLCCYCGKPVSEDSWDSESQGYFSYGAMCMFDHKDGRYVVTQTNEEGTKIIRRFATMGRAESVAKRYARDNAPCVWAKGWSWTAVDTGGGFSTNCDKE